MKIRPRSHRLIAASCGLKSEQTISRSQSYNLVRAVLILTDLKTIASCVCCMEQCVRFCCLLEFVIFFIFFSQIVNVIVRSEPKSTFFFTGFGMGNWDRECLLCCVPLSSPLPFLPLPLPLSFSLPCAFNACADHLGFTTLKVSEV